VLKINNNIIAEIERQIEIIKNINKELKVKKSDNVYQISTSKLSEEELKQVKEKFDILNYEFDDGAVSGKEEHYILKIIKK
jgi:hypothetical protein